MEIMACIYPRTEIRENSGYVVFRKILVNSIIEFKKAKGLKSLDKFEDATWEDVYNVLNICRKNANKYKSNGQAKQVCLCNRRDFTYGKCIYFCSSNCRVSSKEFL